MYEIKMFHQEKRTTFFVLLSPSMIYDSKSHELPSLIFYEHVNIRTVLGFEFQTIWHLALLHHCSFWNLIKKRNLGTCGFSISAQNVYSGFGSNGNAFYLYRATSAACSSTPYRAHAHMSTGCGYRLLLSTPCNTYYDPCKRLCFWSLQ